MKALYYDEQIGYQGIKIGDLPVPEISDKRGPGQGQGLLPQPSRCLGHGRRLSGPGPLPHIFASDASGVVEKAGPGVPHVKPGDPVSCSPDFPAANANGA